MKSEENRTTLKGPSKPYTTKPEGKKLPLWNRYVFAQLNVVRFSSDFTEFIFIVDKTNIRLCDIEFKEIVVKKKY